MATKKVIPAKITARWLKAVGACPDAVARFRTEFPLGVSHVTAATVRRAIHAGIDVGWIANSILDAPCNGKSCTVCFSLQNAVALAASIRAAQKKAPRA